MGWRKAKKKGELPICNVRITKFALEPRFEAFVAHTGMDVPEAPKKAERYSWNLWDNHGSPCIAVGIDSDWDFLSSFQMISSGTSAILIKRKVIDSNRNTK